MGAEENKIQKEILGYLNANGIFCWRNNSNAQRGRSNGYMTGQGDIIGITPDGFFLSIEIKTRTGKVSQAQKDFIAEINERGGVAFVARSVDDLAKPLEYWIGL